MRDPKRISKFMTVVKDLWRLNPDLRFGQLILNAVEADSLYYMEDDELLEKITNLYSGSEGIDEELNRILKLDKTSIQEMKNEMK